MAKDILRFEGSSYINPLFWQHGEDEQTLRTEIQKMKEGCINDFIVEARPHKEYLEDGWWRDLDIIIDEAKKLDMRVWFFDDGDYPSGNANGLIAKLYPRYLKKYWTENHIDVTGPLRHSHFLVDDWLLPGEEVFRVVAARRTDRNNVIDAGSLIDLTVHVRHKRLYWDVPEGEWRIFIVKISPYGGEAHTMGHVNPLDRKAVGTYIELIYEAHYKRYSQYFGNTVAGFFTDEPRFGNTVGYNCVIGSVNMPLPYCDGLLDMLGESPLGAFAKYLPCLWYAAADASKDARYVYMDTVSRLFGENFLGQMGDWCRAHGVKLIGHIVEENGAHTRLGYGAGHFFRATDGMDTSGLDIVNNLLPEQTDGYYTTAFNYYDCDFNHWGLAKMASSAARLDPKKNGVTICEAFGAYGWFEGLKLMKWITDALAVRGVNYFVPHAFSPAPFPDPDCPPHFYAGGNNPQWRYFRYWSEYTNRTCHLISGGGHIAAAAVLYHAEAEWGGACEPFEKAVKQLAQRQVDCDVVPADALLSGKAAVTGGRLHIHSERYRCLIVPYSENLPSGLLKKLGDFARSGLKVVFMTSLPRRSYFDEAFDTDGFEVCRYEDLYGIITQNDYEDIRLSEENRDLIYYHYRKEGADIYFLTNQSTKNTVDTAVSFKDTRQAVFYDAYEDRKYGAEQTVNGDTSEVRLYLEPWQSIFVLFGTQGGDAGPRVSKKEFANCMTVDGEWTISTAASKEYPRFTSSAFHALADMAHPDYLPDFSGTIRYEIDFHIGAHDSFLLDLGNAYETAEVWINGRGCGVRICPPYHYAVDKTALKEGANRLTVEVTNTLVKTQHSNIFDRYFPQEPTGLLGPVKIYY